MHEFEPQRLLLLGAITASLAIAPAYAAEEEETEEVTVIGTRNLERSAADLAVPVDVVDGESIISQGSTRMDQMISTVVPSFNVGQQPLSDAATIVRPANMRGLAADSTLVLINGKRRHRGSVITFLAAGNNQGAHAVDLESIPAIAVGHMEVLRDGASAQYGSDAIAGVINFALKDAPDGGSIEARYGKYYQGDGENIIVSANKGLPLTDQGFLNLSAEYSTSKPTVRAVQRGDAAKLTAAGNTAVRNPVIEWGAPDIDDNYKLFANAGIEVGESTEVYSFGSYAERTVDGTFYFRNPNSRGGVFVTHTDTASDVLFIDADGAQDLDCTGSNLDVRGDANVDNTVKTAVGTFDCYSLHQKFPGGFTPRFGADVEDSSFALGLRGGEQGELTYDASFVWGEHESDFFIYRTVNPQLIYLKNDIPTHYDPGTYIETDYTFNLDFTTEFELSGMASPVHMGFGLEYRKEQFEIEAGEENSWYIHYQTDANGDYVLDNTGKRIPLLPSFGVGSNGFVGFRPEDAGKHSRVSSAAYLDFETNLNEDLLAQVAFRHENPDDYDSRTDGKFAFRYQANDTMAVRSSFSTGFRVPTVGQENIRNTTTAFSNNRLTDRLTLPAKHPALSTLGLAPRLEEEEAQSFALGGVFNFGEWDVTLDYYHIEVDDRIAQSSEKNLNDLLDDSLDDSLTGTDRTTALTAKRNELNNLVPEAATIGEVVYFLNAYDTRTEGVDIVATGQVNPFDTPTDVLFVANWTQTEVSRHNPDAIKYKRIHQVERGVPKVRATLTATHTSGPWSFMGRTRFYGTHIEYSTDSDARLVDINERVLFDLEVGYNWNDDFEFIAGVENIFNSEPTRNPYAADTGLEFVENPVIDGSGGFYYVKARYLF